MDTDQQRPQGSRRGKSLVRVERFSGVRQARAIADICVRTALAGDDASGVHQDQSIVSDVYATPYLVRDPGLCFVLLHDRDVVGYVVAADSSASFADWFRSQWWPSRRALHTVRPDEHPGETRIRGVADEPHAGLPPADELDAYPAHLHIDLLPEARGLGAGRRLMEALFDALGTRGVPGVHLSHGRDNIGAAAFYARLGFTPLPSGTVESPRLARALDR